MASEEHVFGRINYSGIFQVHQLLKLYFSWSWYFYKTKHLSDFGTPLVLKYFVNDSKTLNQPVRSCFQPSDIVWIRSLTTFAEFRGVSSCILMLYLEHCLLGSPSRVKQEAQWCVVKTGQTGNDGQPVKETEVPTDYQNHLLQKRQQRETGFPSKRKPTVTTPSVWSQTCPYLDHIPYTVNDSITLILSILYFIIVLLYLVY